MGWRWRGTTGSALHGRRALRPARPRSNQKGEEALAHIADPRKWRLSDRVACWESADCHCRRPVTPARITCATDWRVPCAYFLFLHCSGSSLFVCVPALALLIRLTALANRAHRCSWISADRAAISWKSVLV